MSWIRCKTSVGRSGSVKREPKPHGAVPRTALRGRDHHFVCSVVFALLAQFGFLLGADQVVKSGGGVGQVYEPLAVDHALAGQGLAACFSCG